VLRLSALLASLLLAANGCGIILRTRAAPLEVPMPTTAPTVVISPDPVAPRPNPVLPPAPIDPLVLQPGQTVVSITFDDGRASNAVAARMLTEHGLTGTFYVNSGTIEEPGYLTLPDLDGMALSGHEIGGHTVNHPDLKTFTTDEIWHQVCDDRNTLLSWGFSVRSFAYPFGSTTAEAQQIVHDCGYNSARDLGDLWAAPAPECEGCDLTETVPPVQPMNTRAPPQVKSDWTTEDFQQTVNDATAVGGWVQLTFHGLCPSDCTDITTPQAPQFEQFITWLADEQAAGRIIVRPVGDVIGGPVQPPVPGPPPTTVVVNPDLEATQDGVPSCWMPAGYGRNNPTFDLVPWSRSGRVASRLIMRDYIDGDAKLLQTEDLGTCAIAVVPGATYTAEAWYISTVPTAFSIQYRTARGHWVFGGLSPKLDSADEYTRARWTLPPIPEGVTAVSFGLTLAQNGELVTDDYSFTAGGPPP
jgi:peptidoglycan/xylan/chitin deacetylase (PgdA/CDA1 family)